MALSYAVTTFASSADATTTTGNLSHTVGANVSLLVVEVALRRSATSTTTIVSVVWNGQTLTAVAGSTQNNATSRTTTALYYLESPAAATGNLVVTWTTGHLCSYGVAAINVTGSTGAPSNGTGQTGSATSSSLAVTSSSGNDVIDVIAANETRTLGEGAGQTTLFATINPAGTSGTSTCGSKETATGASTTMSWTITSSSNYAHSACMITLDTGGGGPTYDGKFFQLF